MKTNEPWREVQKNVHASAIGPSGIPYKVYKRCLMLLRRLWKLLRRMWAKGIITLSGKRVDSSENSQFQTISLLSIEGKIFFSVLARRMTTYMVKIKYVDTSIQKGSIPGFSGCLEHTGAPSQIICEAKEIRGNFTVVRLDFV